MSRQYVVNLNFVNKRARVHLETCQYAGGEPRITGSGLWMGPYYTLGEAEAVAREAVGRDAEIRCGDCLGHPSR